MDDAPTTPGLSEEQLEILRLVESQVMSAEEAARILEALDRAAQPPRPMAMGVPPPAPSPEPAPMPGRGESWAGNVRIRITDLNSETARVNLVLPSRLIDSGIKMVKRMAPEQMSVLDGKDIRRSMEEGFWGPLLDITDDKQRVEIIVESVARDDDRFDGTQTRKLR
jgi:hypothetical protein